MRPDAADSPPDWRTLGRAIDGELVLPGSQAYGRVHLPFNLRFSNVRPLAVVRCARPEDVAETIAFLTRHDLESVPRSGGHCFAGHPPAVASSSMYRPRPR
jgi:FAD/FMN-containing dehydrogenase